MSKLYFVNEMNKPAKTINIGAFGVMLKGIRKGRRFVYDQREKRAIFVNKDTIVGMAIPSSSHILACDVVEAVAGTWYGDRGGEEFCTIPKNNWLVLKNAVRVEACSGSSVTYRTLPPGTLVRARSTGNEHWASSWLVRFPDQIYPTF